MKGAPRFTFAEWPAVAGVSLVALNPMLQSVAVTRDVVGQGVGAGLLPLVGLALIVLSLSLKRRARIGSLNRFNVTLIALLGSLGVMHSTLSTLDGVLQSTYFLVSFLVVPTCAAMALGPRRALYVLLSAVLLYAGVLCIGSLVIPQLFFVQLRSTYTPHRLGWFANPNMYGVVALGGLVSMVLRSAWHQSSAGDSVIVRWGLYLTFLVAIVLSESRASGLALLVFSLVLLLLFRDEILRLGYNAYVVMVAGFVLTAGVITGFVYSDSIINGIGGFVYKHDGELSGGRLYLWQHLLRSWWAEAPLFGMGIESASNQSQALGYSGSHSAYLRLLLQHGLVGAVVVVSIVASSVRTLRSGDGRDRVVLAAFTAVLVHSMFEDHLFSLGITISSIVFAQVIMVGPRQKSVHTVPTPVRLGAASSVVTPVLR